MLPAIKILTPFSKNLINFTNNCPKDFDGGNLAGSYGKNEGQYGRNLSVTETFGIVRVSRIRCEEAHRNYL